MLACARLGAVHSVVFGGFAAHELAARIDDARPAVIVTASCGIEPTRIVEYKPMLDAALEIAEHAPPACVILQREQRPCEPLAGRDLDWRELMADAATRRRGARRGHRPALRALHLRHHRQAQGHRPRQRRPCGRAAVEHAQHLRHRTRRGVVGRLRRRLGGRPLLHRLRAAADRRDDRALRGQAGRHPGRRRVLAGRVRARREGAVHRADRDPRDQEGGPRRHCTSASTTCRRCSICSWPASGSTPTPTTGRRTARRPGRRPLVADRDRLADRRQPDGPRADADQAGLADGADARLRRADPAAGRLASATRTRRARSACGCRCRPGRCRRCGATTSATSRRTCRRSPATTSPATAGTSTRTATCS